MSHRLLKPSQRKRSSAISVESTKVWVPGAIAGHQRPCCSITPRSVKRCSSSTVANQGCLSAPGSKACCSYSPVAKSTHCDTPASTSRTSCPSTPSIGTDQVQSAQRNCSSKARHNLLGHQSLTSAAVDLEKGIVVEHAV